MKKLIGLSLFVLALAFGACNYEREDVSVPEFNEDLSEKSAQITLTEVQLEAATTETEYEVEFYANAEETLTRWWKIGKRFSWNNKLRYRINHCPDLQIQSGDDDGYPKTITLNYGDSTVLNNGTVLSGEIVIEISAPRRSKDYIRTVQYNDFGIDSLQIDGFSSVEVDKVDEMFRKFTTDFTITLADGTVITRSSERVWQWLAGFDTVEDQTDDVVAISGKAQANMGGETYKKEITNTLKRTGGCKYIVEGTVTITLNGDLLSIMDYGDGTCDNIAVMTDADGNVTEIDLEERKAYRHQKQHGYQNQNQNQYQNGNQNQNQNQYQNGNQNQNQNGNQNQYQNQNGDQNLTQNTNQYQDQNQNQTQNAHQYQYQDQNQNGDLNLAQNGTQDQDKDQDQDQTQDQDQDKDQAQDQNKDQDQTQDQKGTQNGN